MEKRRQVLVSVKSIDQELWRQVKIAAVKSDETVSVLVERALRNELARMARWMNHQKAATGLQRPAL